MTEVTQHERYRRTIFMRVLAVVIAAGLASLVAAAIAMAVLVRDYLEAQLVEDAIRRTEAMATGIAHDIELVEIGLRATSRAVDADEDLDVTELMSENVLALRSMRGEVEVLDVARSAEAHAMLRRDDLTGADGVVIASQNRLLVRTRAGDLVSSAIIDISGEISVPPGWSVELLSQDDARLQAYDDPELRRRVLAGGVIAYRGRAGDNPEHVQTLTSIPQGIVLSARAPLAPAQETSLAVTRNVLLWSSLAVIPLLILAWLLGRAVTSPIRALATTVRRARGAPLELPPLNDDEIGDLGAAIHTMSSRLHHDAEAQRTTAKFAWRVGELADERAVLEALEASLRLVAPSLEWAVMSLSELEDEKCLELEGFSSSQLRRMVGMQTPKASLPNTDEGSSGSDGARTKTSWIPGGDIPIRTQTLADSSERVIVLRDGEKKYGVVAARGDTASDVPIRYSDLLCRVAIVALRDLELIRKSQAQEKLAILGRVSAAVVHELNNPLTFMLVNLELLGSCDDVERRTLVKELGEGAEHMASILRDLASMSRGGLKSELAEVDLSEVATKTVRVAAARSGGIEIEVETSYPVIVKGDSGQLRQVVLNLLINAVDAVTERPDAHVKVSVRREGFDAVMDVEDNGLGIPESAREQIFEAFFTSKGYQGTGLGLYISRFLVEAQGGSLQLARTSEEGTVFRVSMPLEHQSTERAEPN